MQEIKLEINGFAVHSNRKLISVFLKGIAREKKKMASASFAQLAKEWFYLGMGGRGRTEYNAKSKTADQTVMLQTIISHNALRSFLECHV